ncbi:hypothetical protein [Streptomyces sp. CBMA123]|uniref:hypothetical protein n=1 Tax=Streptomyces sp. CBMA123 TaxID=1896313 RepID=UPI00166197A8|nr:hypothetical protein [Streptomyces sp. CBMA123]MBD0694107.1 hypothetical protein [Streptomyces sp. CBMA123]
MPDTLPDPWAVVRGTDWPSLKTARGTGKELPGVLARLLGPDLTAEETGQALDALEPVRHQDTIYEATAPAALCVAAVLARRAEEHPGGADGVCVLLLGWLAGVAYDSDDACVAAADRYFEGRYLDASPAMVAIRALRPALYLAVAPFLGDPDTAGRDTALAAALAFAEHPDLAPHREGLAEHARNLLLVSDTRWRRWQAIDALTSWGYDTTGLTRPDDDDRSPLTWPSDGWNPGQPPF